jgi:hypothetical protein
MNIEDNSIVISDEQEEVSQIPQDLIEIQKALSRFNSFKSVVDTGSFSGKNSKEVADLRDFIQDMYKQTYAKLEAHPYYREVMGMNE